jgi:hypothetical protein
VPRRSAGKQPDSLCSGCLACWPRAGCFPGSVGRKVGCSRSRASLTVGQCNQEAQCCLTHRSSGAPTSRRTGHQAQGLRPILRLLSSTPRCWLPLTSNVRQHSHAVRYASISIQMQHAAAVGSIQSVAPSCVAFAQVVAKPNACPASNAALTSFGVRESCRWFAYRQDPISSAGGHACLASRWGQEAALAGIASQSCRPRRWLWPSQRARLVWREQRGCRGAVGQILVVVSWVSRTVGQCKQEAQRCLTLRSSGAPTSRRTGHQAQGLRPILRLLSSAPRCWLPLTSNVRQHVQALRFASVSIQMQLPAAVASIQIAVPCFCGSSQGRGQANHACRHQRSAHVLRRSRVPESLCPQPKHNEFLPLAFASHQSQVGAFGTSSRVT